MRNGQVHVRRKEDKEIDLRAKRSSTRSKQPKIGEHSEPLPGRAFDGRHTGAASAEEVLALCRNLDRPSLVVLSSAKDLIVDDRRIRAGLSRRLVDAGHLENFVGDARIIGPQLQPKRTKLDTTPGLDQ